MRYFTKTLMNQWLVTTRTGTHRVKAYQVSILACGALIFGSNNGQMTYGFSTGEWVRFEPIAGGANAKR